MAQYLTLAYVLIFAGLLLLVAELFIPSGGALLAASLGALAIGVAMTFIYSDDPTIGVITLVSILILVPLLGRLLLQYWPKTRVGRRFFLHGPDEDATIASMPVNIELEQLRGHFGRAVSALRPAGVAEFDGKRVDVLTEGFMVEPGQWVRCIDVKAGKVFVRPVDKPDIGDLEKPFLD
jgi:membrane-bound serine protease (ClpP class)